MRSMKLISAICSLRTGPSPKMHTPLASTAPCRPKGQMVTQTNIPKVWRFMGNDHSRAGPVRAKQAAQWQAAHACAPTKTDYRLRASSRLLSPKGDPEKARARDSVCMGRPARRGRRGPRPDPLPPSQPQYEPGSARKTVRLCVHRNSYQPSALLGWSPSRKRAL